MTDQIKTYTALDDFLFSDWNSEFANVYSAINALGTSGLPNASVTEVKMADDANVAAYFGELFQDGAVPISGDFIYVSDTGLDVTITGGVAYVLKTSSTPDKLLRINIASNTTYTVLDNTTNYLDLGADGVIDVTQSATPSADHTRILEVVAASASISSTTDKADRDFLADTLADFKAKKVLWQVSSATAVVVTSGTRFRDTTNVKTFEFTGNVTADITNSVGALGLDQGAEASSTWYAIVGIGDSSGVNDPSVVFVTAANYAGSIALPSGYDMYSRLGWVRNDGSSDFIQGDFHYDRFIYNDAQSVLTGGSSTSFATITMTSVIPPTCRHGLLYGDNQTAASSGSMEWRITGTSASAGHAWAGIDVASESSGYGGVFIVGSGQQIDYKGTTAVDADVEVNGWIELFEEDS